MIDNYPKTIIYNNLPHTCPIWPVTDVFFVLQTVKLLSEQDTYFFSGHLNRYYYFLIDQQRTNTCLSDKAFTL